jgi:hypothetical protein
MRSVFPPVFALKGTEGCYPTPNVSASLVYGSMTSSFLLGPLPKRSLSWKRKPTLLCYSSKSYTNKYFICLYSPLLDLDRFFSFLILHTVRKTPWRGDQPVARPLLTHRTTETRKKRTQYRLHALSGTRTQDPKVRTSEDSSCLRPCGHCDRHNKYLYPQMKTSLNGFTARMHVRGGRKLRYS